MTIDATLYSIFADISYKNEDQIRTALVGSNWTVLSIDSKYVTPGAGGFAAVAYGLDANDDGIYEQVVIAYRGSDNPADWLGADSEIALGQIPTEQLSEAVAFYAAVNATYGTDNGNNLSITGHSLGGALAQLVSANFGNYAVTFNAPGMANQKKTMDFLYSNVLNYVIMNDVVGTMGEHVGNTLYFTPTETSTGLGIFQPHLDYINTDFNNYFAYENWTFADTLSLVCFDVNNPLNSNIVSSIFTDLSNLSSTNLGVLGLATEAISTIENLIIYLKTTVLPKTIDKLEKDFGVNSLLTTTIHCSTDAGDYIIDTNAGSELTGKKMELLGLTINDNFKDFIWGNDGSDTIVGGSGNDTIFGDNSSKTIDELKNITNSIDSPESVNDGADRISAGAGNDIIIGGGGNLKRSKKI